MRDLASLLENALFNGCRVFDALGEHSSAEIEEVGSSIEEQLLAFDPKPLEPVIILISNTAHDIAAFYAAWRKDLVAVPLHEAAPSNVIDQMKETVGARFVIKKGKVEAGDKRPHHSTLPDDTALIIFTSGSTGQPKGVMLGHQRLADKIEVLNSLLKFNATDKVAVPLQLTFVFGIWVSLLAMKARATLILKQKFSVNEMMSDLQAGASVIAVVPTMLRSMPLDNAVEATSLRQILTGGEPFIAALAEKISGIFPQATIFDLYGSTETGSCDFYLDVTRPEEFGTIGRPTSQVNFRIVSENDCDCATNEAGELRIFSPFAMLGYFGDKTVTSAAFDDKHYFRTGDIAFQQNNGLVKLAGRKKEIVSRGGIKISPLEVDSIFSKHPDVAAALSGGVPDARLGESLHVLIVRREGAKLDAEDLLNWAAARMERTKIPNSVHFVDALPLGRTGKADRSSVKTILLT